MTPGPTRSYMSVLTTDSVLGFQPHSDPIPHLPLTVGQWEGRIQHCVTICVVQILAGIIMVSGSLP